MFYNRCNCPHVDDFSFIANNLNSIKMSSGWSSPPLCNWKCSWRRGQLCVGVSPIYNFTIMIIKFHHYLRVQYYGASSLLSFNRANKFALASISQRVPHSSTLETWLLWNHHYVLSAPSSSWLSKPEDRFPFLSFPFIKILFIPITMFFGTDDTMRSIPSFMLNVRNIWHNIVSPIEHCYGYEQCYD